MLHITSDEDRRISRSKRYVNKKTKMEFDCLNNSLIPAQNYRGKQLDFPTNSGRQIFDSIENPTVLANIQESMNNSSQWKSFIKIQDHLIYLNG